MNSNKKTYQSVNRLSYQPQKKVEVSVDILDPYKSHTNLSWIGCHQTDYSRDWSITTLPPPPSYVIYYYLLNIDSIF